MKPVVRWTIVLAVGMVMGGPSLLLAQEGGGRGGMETAYAQLIRDLLPRAIEVVEQAAESSDPFFRANAIEAMMPMTERVLVLAQDGLGDPSPVVRFVALMAVGQKNLGSLGPMAVAMTQDPSRNVQAAAIFAAYKTGARQDLSRLAGFLASSDPGLRRNTAMLLGLVGDTSAIPMIRELSARPMRRATAQEAELAQIEAAKAMVLLGDDESLEIVEAGAFSGFGEVRVISIMALGELDDRRMQPALNRMLSVGMPEQAPEVRIAAAEALARMGFAAGLDVLVEASQQQFIPFEGRQVPAELLRVQSARGLGLIQDVRAATALGRLLNDPNPQVRLSAAGAVITAWARLEAGRLR